MILIPLPENLPQLILDRNSRLTGHITEIEKVQDLWTKFADFLIFDVFLIGILKKIQFFFKMQIFDRGTKDIPSKHILPNPTPPQKLDGNSYP